jgi:hypothetical protein
MAKRTRDVVGVQRRYRWRIYPTAAQAACLERQAVMCAQLWNALLDMCERRRQRAVGPGRTFHCGACAALSDGKKSVKLCPDHCLPTEFDMGYWVTDMLAQCPEWRALSTWTPRRVATSMAAAWQAFFRRMKELSDPAVYAKQAQAFLERRGRKPTRFELAGYPLYKSTRRNFAVPHRCVSGCKIEQSAANDSHWTVRLKGVRNAGWHDPKHRLREGIRALHRGGMPAPVTEWTDADIILRPDGHWEMSAAVIIAPRRLAGARPIVVKFDLLDGFAIVDNERVELDGLAHARSIAERVEAMQTAFDLRYPLGRRLTDDEHEAKREDALAIARGHVKAANARRHALHNWSNALVARASALTIVAPPVREATASARGTARAPGAAVADAAAVNKRVLSYAPASAIAMLKYKAAEAGIACTVIDDPAPKTAIKPALVGAAKTIRGINRGMRGLAHGG